MLDDRPVPTVRYPMNIPLYPPSERPGFIAAALDRRGEWRNAPASLASVAADAGVIPLFRYQVPVQDGRAVVLPATAFADQLAQATWLGLWQGQSIYALPVADPAAAALTGIRFSDLRGAALHLEPDDAAVLAYARAMLFWQRQHRHCGRCGSPTRPTHAGHVLRCDPCDKEHYPRTDPSMLVLVRSEDRCLLGRQRGWPPVMWSILAGFVEPGESIEDAVIREVWEEARIEVTGMRYLASQPWPFPASVLLGFHATAVAATPTVEQDELEAADWFSRARIQTEVQAGQLRLPPPFTLSYRLLEAWYDEAAEQPLRSLLDASGAWGIRKTPPGH